MGGEGDGDWSGGSGITQLLLVVKVLSIVGVPYLSLFSPLASTEVWKGISISSLCGEFIRRWFFVRILNLFSPLSEDKTSTKTMIETRFTATKKIRLYTMSAFRQQFFIYTSLFFYVSVYFPGFRYIFRYKLSNMQIT